MPQPPIPTPTIEFKGIDKFLSEFEIDEGIQAGVASKGAAAAYALVWEYGNVRQTKEGPKTTKGIAPDGEVVWLTVQAPSGYIAVNESLYHTALLDELDKVTYSGETAAAIKKELVEAALRTMERVRALMQETAPVDSGQLGSSFYVVKPGDRILDDDAYDDLDERIFYLGV